MLRRTDCSAINALEILSPVTIVETLADGAWGKSNMPITITSHFTQLVLP